MALYAFSIDLDRCIGCQACTVACKLGNERPLGDNYIKVRDIVVGQMPKLFGTFAHHRCFHCADAACVHVCPTGTLSKDANGMTVVDADKCIGCGYCTNACPYIIPAIGPDGRVSKCVACQEPVAEGSLPYCVQTCPSQAIKYGERDKIVADAEARVAALKAHHPNAHVYGTSQLGGLGLVMILLDKPEVYGLLERPRIPSPISIWQRMHPFTIPLAALSAAFTGFAFVIGRREHAKEKAAMHAALAAEQAIAAVQAGEAEAPEPVPTPEVSPADEPAAAAQDVEVAAPEATAAAAQDVEVAAPEATAAAAQDVEVAAPEATGEDPPIVAADEAVGNAEAIAPAQTIEDTQASVAKEDE
jgi:formate dehydrogenase iron-sulfur subunit